MSSSYSIRLFDWTHARNQAMRIREAVFVREQGVPIEVELDEHDAVSEHALAFSPSDEVIGTGRLLPDGHLGRMAVLAPWRRKGAGAAIMWSLLERARERGFGHVVLSAQTHAAAFYQRFGFVQRGVVYLEVAIPHVEMVLSLRPDQSSRAPSGTKSS